MHSVVILIFIRFAFIKGQGCGKGGFCVENEDCFGSKEPTGCEENRVCCYSTGKAEKKCDEYGTYVFKETYRKVLTRRVTKVNESLCAMDFVPMIVGGVMAKEMEFPHMVSIGYGEDLKTAQWQCGGSLISENYILTAAHCAKSREMGPARFVRLGTNNIVNPGKSVLDLDIKKIIIYPRYKPPSRYHDIALMKFSTNVKMSGYIRPACLNTDLNNLRKGVATGWGKLKYGGRGISPNLMKVVLSFFNTTSCNNSFAIDINGPSLAKGIIPSQMCAGEEKGGKDTCQGDSGGPLQVFRQEPFCMYDIVGITSFGKFCGFKNSPAVYTKVSYYVSWIESVVWP